jgi:Tol biopolymer transport system component
MDGESQELWQVELSGEGARRLSAQGQLVQDYDAAPDGSSVIYSVSEGEETVNLWRVNPTQQGMVRLTGDEGVVYGAPRFSPSGDLLALELRRMVEIGDQGPVLSPPRLELRRPTDGSPAGLIYGEGPEVAHSPRWSPDGTRLAFYEANLNALGIFNFTTDVLFFPAESAYLGPQPWDPESRALVYTRVRYNERGAQQLVALRDLQMGTELTFEESTGDQGDPAWSPAGDLIAYAYRPPPGLDAPGGVWVMQPGGSGKYPLVTETGVMFTQPVWSPDGEWLLYARFDMNAVEGGQSLWAVRRDGSDAHQVAENAHQGGWLP